MIPSLQTLTAITRANPLLAYVQEFPGYGGHSGPQETFHRAQHRKRAMVSANGVGKTYCGAAEAWWHLTDSHPYRETPGPNAEGWVLLSDLKQGWKAVCKNMRLLEPEGILDPHCHYVEGFGYLYRSSKMIKVKEECGGGLLVAKGGTQAPLAMEGDKIDWLWVDEPPKRSHWSGCRSRVDRTGGPIWATFTPIGRPVGWLRTMLEGNEDTGEAPEPGWWVEHYGLSAKNAPHLSPAIIQHLIDGCDPWEEPQRIHAEWDGITGGRKFLSFTPHCILTPGMFPDRVDEVRIGMDHGEGILNQIGYIGAIVGRSYYVLAEFTPGKKGSTPDDVAEVCLDALERVGIHPSDVTACFGDINSAGLLGAGGKYNRFLERAFADAMGDPECPFDIDTPRKRKGSVGMGVSAMNTAMKHGRYYVDPSCKLLITALRHFTGKEQDLKNAIDAARYMFLDKLLSWREHAPPPLRRG